MAEKIRFLKIAQSSFMRMYDKNAELKAENARLKAERKCRMKGKCKRCKCPYETNGHLIAGFCKGCAEKLIPALLKALKDMVIQYGGMIDSDVEEEARAAVLNARAIIAKCGKEVQNDNSGG